MGSWRNKRVFSNCIGSVFLIEGFTLSDLFLFEDRCMLVLGLSVFMCMFNVMTQEKILVGSVESETLLITFVTF